MRWVATPNNPIPPGGRAIALRADDGVELRAGLWQPEGAPRGTVALFQGRAEFIEKYFETIADLLARGFSVTALDWRGQGFSTRALRNRRKGHVDDFALYGADVDALVAQVLTPECPRPWYALAHSMGAGALLGALATRTSPFERLTLTSPMLAIMGPASARSAYPAAAAIDALGLGGLYAPGGGNRTVYEGAFPRNVLTSDPVRFARTAEIVAADPDVALGWPTIGWLHAALRLTRGFEDPAFARALQIPTLIVHSGDDHVTSTAASERFCRWSRFARLIVLPDARHELLVERNVFRREFWAAFDAFVPGGESRPK